MQYLDKPFNQVVFFVVISIFLSFSSNLVRKDSIPLLAKKLEITEDIDLESDETTLTAKPLCQLAVLTPLFYFLQLQINHQRLSL